MGLGCLGALGFNGFGILCSGFSGLNGFRDLGLHVEASIIRVGATMLGFRVEGSISDVRGFWVMAGTIRALLGVLRL